jgi:hypothetical protein
VPTYELPEEAVAPRDEANRYAVYVVAGDRMRWLTTSDARGLGQAIVAQDLDAQAAGLRGLVDLGRFGILDRVERRWVVLPWQRREAETTLGPPPARVAL